MNDDFLSKNEMHIFMDLAAAAGITTEQLLGNLIKDLVSAFSCDEISESENNLREWYNGSWFSEDEEYFSFLQYAVKKNIYGKIVSAAESLISEDRMEFLKKEFAEYCLKNSNHLNFSDEVKKIEEYEKEKLEFVGGDV